MLHESLYPFHYCQMPTMVIFVCLCLCLFPVLPAKPVKSKMAPTAMTDTSGLLNDAEWYWGEISR